MAKETMTLEKALKERLKIDKKIQAKLDNPEPLIGWYIKSFPFINGLTVEQTAKHISSNMRSINSLIKRREAINNAITIANSIYKVKVKKMPNLCKFSSGKPPKDNPSNSYEEITLASALNRKAYYAKHIVPLINSFEKQLKKDMSNGDLLAKAQYALFQDRMQTMDEKNIESFKETMINNNEVQKVDPTQIGNLIIYLKDEIGDYIMNIDGTLANVSKTIKVEIEY